MIWNGKVFHDPSFAQLAEEQTGLIFADSTNKKDEGVLVQTGIGQRDVRMTPVQATNMITSVFHQGKTMEPRLVKEIKDAEGRMLFRFREQTIEGAKPLKPETAASVKALMRQVVTDGTASSLKNATWSLAGKTGTAQIGVDKDRYNKWMIGFGPVETPRYSVAVLLRSVDDAGDQRAIKIFEKVMNNLADLEKSGQKSEGIHKNAEKRIIISAGDVKVIGFTRCSSGCFVIPIRL